MNMRGLFFCLILFATASFAQDLGGASLCGRLRDGAGKGIPNARIYLQEHSILGFAMKPSPVVTTGKNGEFSVPKLRGSTYDVYASHSSGPGVLARKIGEVKVLAKPLCTFKLFGW